MISYDIESEFYRIRKATNEQLSKLVDRFYLLQQTHEINESELEMLMYWVFARQSTLFIGE